MLGKQGSQMPWINPCDPVVYHWSKGWHVHILHPIYLYAESSVHNMQRSLVKWALFTFICERNPTLIDMLIDFSVRYCSQFKVRNQSDPFNRVALFRRQPRTCERAGYMRHLNSHWYVYKNIVWKLPWRLIKKMYETVIPVLFNVVASSPALSRLPDQWQKATFATTYLHSTCKL